MSTARTQLGSLFALLLPSVALAQAKTVVEGISWGNVVFTGALGLLSWFAKKYFDGISSNFASLDKKIDHYRDEMTAGLAILEDKHIGLAEEVSSNRASIAMLQGINEGKKE